MAPRRCGFGKGLSEPTPEIMRQLPKLPFKRGRADYRLAKVWQ